MPRHAAASTGTIRRTARCRACAPPGGDRTCYEYDREANPILTTHLPAPGDPLAHERLESAVRYGPLRLPETVFDPESGEPALVFERDVRGNLQRLRSYAGAREVVTGFGVDGRGRVERVTSPNGWVDRVIFDPTNGATAVLILPKGRPTSSGAALHRMPRAGPPGRAGPVGIPSPGN